VFKFKVVILYPENSLSTVERQKGVLIVGEGLGLSWQKKRKLRKGMKNQWFTTMIYKAGGISVLCKKTTECDQSQKYIEFRVFLGNTEMLGPNFRVKLPVSYSLAPKNDLKVPTLRFYPWFKRRECTVVRELERFQIEGLGKRSISVLLPPSFHENTLKRYKTLLVYGRNTLLAMKNVIADLTARRGLMEEIVVLSLEVKDSIQDVTPSHSPVLKCKKKPRRRGDRTCDYCMKCLSDEFTEPCDNFEFNRELTKCTNKWTTPGLGYHYLGYVIDKILPRLVSKFRANINRQSLGIMGYGIAGMMACHAALKWMNRFATAICMSPRLAWPDLVSKRRDFFNLISTSLGKPCSTKLYIDANENDDWQFTTAAILKSAQEAVRLLQTKHGFVLDGNLFFFTLTYRGTGRVDTLKPYIVLSRLWLPLTTVYPAAGRGTGGGSCSSKTKTFLDDNDQSPLKITEAESENFDEETECQGKVSVIALVSGVSGTLVGTLVVTIIVMHFCRPAANVLDKDPLLAE
jgi:hypothetical protein